MFKINLQEYKETKIYFQLFDVLLKKLDVKKELYLIDNGVTPSSYRLARKQEQNIGKIIIKTLCDKLNYKVPTELQIIEMEDKFNKIYFDMYYKINDDYDKYLKYLDDLLSENYIIFPLIKMMKLFLIANSFRDAGALIKENRDILNEIGLYQSFYNESMYEIFDILNTSFNDININDYIMKKYENGLFYFGIASKCLSQLKYIECLHFANKCKEILLAENNYSRLMYINLKIMGCYTHFRRFEECYNLSKTQLYALNSFDYPSPSEQNYRIVGYLVISTVKHYVVSCVCLKKYNEIIKTIEKLKMIHTTELITFLIALYHTDINKYEEIRQEYYNMVKDSNDEELKRRVIGINEIIDQYLKKGIKKRLDELKEHAMIVLIDYLKDS